MIAALLVLPLYVAAQAQELARPPEPPISEESFEALKGDLPNYAELHPWLHRSAQPSDAGFAELAAKGIKTVVNLRNEADLVAREKTVVEALGMRYVSIPMSGVARPKDEDIETFLGLMSDFENYPVLVHCMRGADRTGAAVASYRIRFDGWKVAPAVREMFKFKLVQPAMLTFVYQFYQREHPADLPSRTSTN